MSVWPHLHWPFVFSRIFWNLCCNASRHMGIWERPTWRSPDYPRRLLLLHPWRKASQKFNIYLFYEEEKIIHAYIHTFVGIFMTRHFLAVRHVAYGRKCDWSASNATNWLKSWSYPVSRYPMSKMILSLIFALCKHTAPPSGIWRE